MAAAELTPEEQDRIRRRDSLPVLPDTYDHMVRRVGVARTIKFIRVYGGTEARFPAKPSPEHPMVRILGRRGVQLLRDEYGPIEVRWPQASNYLAMLDARALRTQGMDIHDIAVKVYRDVNTVKRYVSGVEPVCQSVKKAPQKAAPEPLPLFTWRRTGA